MIVANFVVGFALGAVFATVFIAVALAGSLDVFGKLDAPGPSPNIADLTCAISERAAHVVSLLHNGPMTSDKRAAVEEEARGLAQSATALHYWARRGTGQLGELVEQMEQD